MSRKFCTSIFENIIYFGQGKLNHCVTFLCLVGLLSDVFWKSGQFQKLIALYFPHFPRVSIKHSFPKFDQSDVISLVNVQSHKSTFTVSFMKGRWIIHARFQSSYTHIINLIQIQNYWSQLHSFPRKVMTLAMQSGNETFIDDLASCSLVHFASLGR